METLDSWTQCFLFVIRDKNCENIYDSKVSVGDRKPKAYVLLPSCILKGHPKLCQLFRNSHAEVLDHGECSALNAALQNDQVEIVEVLLLPGRMSKCVQVSVEVGNVALIRLILGSHFIVTKLKRTPRLIRSAVDQANLEVLEYLMTHKSDISYSNPRGVTLLHLAVIRNSFVLLNILLVNGVDVDLRRKDGATALHLAVQKGNVTFVRLILHKGASVNAIKNDGSTCVFLAAEKKCEQIFTLLVESGATLPSGIGKFSRLLEVALQKNCNEIVSKLLSHSLCSIPDVERRHIYSALLPMAVGKGRLEVVKQLLMHGADCNKLIPDGRSILHLAVDKESPDMVEIILKHGRDLTSEPKNKKALQDSVRRKGANCAKITEMLLQHGLTVDTKEISDAELFHFAVRRNYLEVIQQLLSYGADPNIKFDDHERYYGNITPLIVAIRYGNRDILELLLRNGADANIGCGWNCMPVLEAIREFDASAVKLLVEHGAKITDPELLIAAVRRGKADIVKTLLQKGADPNAKCYYRNSHGDIPIAIAAMHNNVKLTDMLLKYGADIDGSNGNRSVPLHVASEYGNLPVVDYLIKSNVDLEKKNEIGASALATAARRGYFNIVDLLLKAGASYEFMSILGASVLDCTPLEIPQDIFQFFFDHGVADKKLMSVMGHLFKVALACNESISNNALWCSSKNFELKLARHMIKLEAAGLHYDPFDPTPEWYRLGKTKENYRRACEAEVSCMKAKNIENTNVSYYDILTSDLCRLTCYARNANVAQVADTEEFLAKSFPIYASIIFYQLRKGLIQKDLVEGGAKRFHFVFKECPKLPNEVVENVFSYLRNQDVMVFVNAVSPAKV